MGRKRNTKQDKSINSIPKGVLNEYTRVVLVNAIYFLGTWASPFNQNKTTEEPFTTYNTLESDHSSTKSITVNMMHQTRDFEICDVEAMDSRAVRMNYTGGQLSMVIILPNKERGLQKAEENLKHFYFAACFV